MDTTHKHMVDVIGFPLCHKHATIKPGSTYKIDCNEEISALWKCKGQLMLFPKKLVIEDVGGIQTKITLTKYRLEGFVDNPTNWSSWIIPGRFLTWLNDQPLQMKASLDLSWKLKPEISFIPLNNQTDNHDLQKHFTVENPWVNLCKTFQGFLNAEQWNFQLNIMNDASPIYLSTDLPMLGMRLRITTITDFHKN